MVISFSLVAEENGKAHLSSPLVNSTETAGAPEQVRLLMAPATAFLPISSLHTFSSAVKAAEHQLATDFCSASCPSNAAMWRVFEPELRRRLGELEAMATTSERVRALLLELLPSNSATIETVAERLGMSRRTLQRRLEDEGENFRALVNATRESLARHYLTRTRMSGGEIAFLLGFEDPNSFYRAFHEWTGQTPETIRQLN